MPPTAQSRRRPVPAGFSAAILLAAAVLLFGGAAMARRHQAGGASVAGDFEYYLLSLSWSPAFCLESPAAAECNGVRRYGFIAHGLWPQDEDGSPQYCAGHRRVPEDVAAGMADLMPARGLVYHEWTAHGRCSGLAPAQFFSLLRRAYENLRIPPAFAVPRVALETSPPAIVAAFAGANPGLPPQAVVVTCGRRAVPRLREVRICLTRDLAPRACARAALRGRCRARSLIVPPPR